ncbi:MAG: stage II sporulation protein R [Clostridia bacterium]|nr:stage II sporulation protein R [Clostridia bacterium]
MQKRLLTATLALCAVLLFLGLFPVHGEAEIYDTVVRLHVLANSDSDEDQALKLRVRDAVLEVTSPLLADCTSQEEARALIEAHTDDIRTAAEAVIAAEGRTDTVSILLGEEEYPERDYDSFCFPAGTYLSLRVCIGDAEGKNWWCCLFPPLCLGTSTATTQAAEEEFIAVGLTPSQYKIITESEKPVYKVRFKILEVFQSLW